MKRGVFGQAQRDNLRAVLLHCLKKVENKEIVVDFDQDSKNTVF
ncbi:hypothetical protein QIA19_04855 (plasmid) [Borreliella finlandensis]|uniref:Uncharacterized protein n=1 Tax=Borreliella finlandensis TaxID=498741 RepID=A0A806CL37_9SPIR|nr:hypothetical protein [Borreliella finlandensis]ACN93502.1 hypothetical protein BSV1_I11 [Borreliella finlandensis]